MFSLSFMIIKKQFFPQILKYEERIKETPCKDACASEKLVHYWLRGGCCWSAYCTWKALCGVS